jgi:subtilisin family serine protease
MEVTKNIILSLSVLALLTSCNDTSSPPQNQVAASTKPSCASAEIKNRFIVKWKNGGVTTELAQDRESFNRGFISAFSNEIEFAEHDHIIRIDARVSAQQNVNTESTVAADWGQQMVQAPAVWSQGINGNGTLVAVIDSGADYNHPQLVNQIAINAGEMGKDANGKDKSNNGIDDDSNGYIDDYHGYNFADPDDNVPVQAKNDPMDTNKHGTHVSGIIAAQHSAGPILGMAEGAKILPLRFINASGGGSVSSAIQAINYAANAHAKVINASWGGSDCSKILQDTIAGLESKGVLFVAAAGNDNQNLDNTPSFPAAYAIPGQITVAATTELDAQAEFSNYSFTLTQIGAPGLEIMSTVPGGKTLSLDGTSMATPFVAGAAALLFGMKPTATVAQVKAALLKSVDLAQIAVSSGGRMNVKKATDLFH